jgi:CubicO group peptidase (beta-lactamase class C family)
MKKACIIILFIAMQFSAVAQDKQPSKMDSVSGLVKKYFNEKNSTALYELMGNAFRSFLSYSSFRNVCDQNLFPLGKIKEITFESLANGVAKYKTKFNTVILELLLGLDSSEKIELFQFKPYADENTKKTESVLSSNPMVSPLDQYIDTLGQRYMTRMATTGLSIGVLKNGRRFFYGYGETAKGNKKLPDEHTLYEIGSISKTFTAVLLADAAIRGYVSLEDPINKYLPSTISRLQYEGVPISLKTLANHTSGIPSIPSNLRVTDITNPFKDYDTALLFSFYAHFKPERKAGTQYEYSNLAVGTLGVILERVYEKNYESLVIEKICRPLGMEDTRQFIRKKDSARFAKGYNENGYYSPPWDFKAMAGAGAIRSTASDLLKYANANLGNGPARISNAMQLTHTLTYSNGPKVGLAWHLIKPGNEEILFHNGATGGYRSYLAINAKQKFAVVILSNTAIETEELGDNLMKWLETNQ